MKYKILINTIPLMTSNLTGIGRYVYEISKKISEDKTKIKSNYYYGYYSDNLIGTSQYTRFKEIKILITKIPFIKKILRKLINSIGKFYKPSYDVYWEPNFIPLDFIKAKKVVTTVHDFSFELYKEYHPKERIEYFEMNFYKNIKKSDFIITVSDFCRQEVLERLNFDENKVFTIYNGIDHSVFKVYNKLNLDFEIPKKFILSVGSIEPRKNLMGLLKAYNRLPKGLKSEYKLVLVGFKGWKNIEIMDLIESNKKNIIYLGFISDEELAKVYNLASVFVFPSFYEGFGLPVLESMACGTPVVCSNISSIPEIGADAVVYCNPYDINDIKSKIQIVLEDKTFQNTLIKKGLERSKKFSWEKSAKQHKEVFKKVLSEK